MNEQELKNKWNPHKTSVPKSKKLKLHMRGFEIMGNYKEDRHPGSLKPETTGYKIIDVLKQYENYPEDNLKLLISDKKPETIRKIIKKLESSGFIIRKKIHGKNYVSLSRFCKELLEIDQEQSVHDARKIRRLGDIALATMMFDKTIPFHSETGLIESYFETKPDIVKQNPGCEKVINISRVIGIYHHYGQIIPVYKMGATMRWIDNTERQVKEYLEEQVYHTPITKAIYFIDDYNEAIKYLYPSESGTRNYGEALRESFELSTCYEKAFLFTVDNLGMKQLELFRSYAKIEDLFLEAVFEEEQKSNTPDSVVDGYIDDINCIVLFSGDIIRIKQIRRILETGMLDCVNIICYNFQEDYLRLAFETWSDRVIYNSYSLKDLREVFSG